MATRCLISKENNDGSYRVIYSHWDGGPKGVGHTLLNFYTNDEIIDRLLCLGCLSSLGRYIEPQPGVPHSFVDPAKDTTVAYHRDRGDSLSVYDLESEQDFLEWLRNSFLVTEYLYVWTKEKEWAFHNKRGEKLSERVLLSSYFKNAFQNEQT